MRNVCKGAMLKTICRKQSQASAQLCPAPPWLCFSSFQSLGYVSGVSLGLGATQDKTRLK